MVSPVLQPDLSPGRWVRIHRVELAPGERSSGSPEDTASVPFESWTNGRLAETPGPDGIARVRTASGRLVTGRLVAVDPGYDHSFGAPPAALQQAGERARARLFGPAGR